MLRGFLGRLTIAIEPLIVSAFFAFLPIALLLRKQEIALFLTPIFAFAALTFLAYAIALMVPPVRAVFETFAPIYTVDGYVRYRTTHKAKAAPQYYVAVLNAEREMLGEWSLNEWPAAIGKTELWPVMVEFSRYGGIHKIDGHTTGVLPAETAPLGIGIARDAERQATRSAKV